MAKYPLGMDKRGKAAMDVLLDGIAGGSLYNVDYQNACFTLGRVFEEAVRAPAEAMSDRSLASLVRSVSDALPYVTSIKRLIKDYEGWLKDPTVPTYLFNEFKTVPEVAIAAVRETLEVLRSWMVYVEARETLKPMLVKGRKPTPKKAPDPNAPKQTKGTCCACFRPMVVHGGKVVRHGWQENGWRRAGQYGNATHVGSCFCVGFEPFEVSPEGTKRYLAEVLVAHRDRQAQYVARLKAKPEELSRLCSSCPMTYKPFDVPKGQTYRSWPGKPVTVKRDAKNRDERQVYEDWLDSDLREAEADLEAVKREIKKIEAAIAGWKPGTLWEE